MAKPVYTHLDVKFTQLIIGQFVGEKGASFSTIALGDNGKVYKYSAFLSAWEELNHELVKH